MIQKKDPSKQLKLLRFVDEVVICQLCGESILPQQVHRLDSFRICEHCNDQEMYKDD